MQEIVLKKKLIKIVSSSKTLSSIFYNEAEGINLVLFGKEDVTGMVEQIQESSVAFEHVEEIFYCLKSACCRVIKTLDKILIFGIINFVSQAIVGSDLFRLQS